MKCKILRITLVCWLIVLFIVPAVVCQTDRLPTDFQPLSDFYLRMGTLYGDLKTITVQFTEGYISGAGYHAAMQSWKNRFDELDTKAPCPKNAWRETYTILTGLHYDICFAWSDLGALHTNQLLLDPEMMIYHETLFREASVTIAEKLSKPDPDPADDDPFASLKKP
jgi:hypothetical protein